jgi:hypothetical protein
MLQMEILKSRKNALNEAGYRFWETDLWTAFKMNRIVISKYFNQLELWNNTKQRMPSQGEPFTIQHRD